MSNLVSTPKVYPLLDELLDNIDTSFASYNPSIMALEFFAIIRGLHGEDFEIPNAKVHYFMVDMMLGKVKREQFPYGVLNSRIQIDLTAITIAMARGLSKSTVGTFFFPLYCAIKGETPVVGKFSHMLVLSDTQEGGAKSQYEMIVKFMDNHESQMRLFFESWKSGNYTIELVRKGEGEVKDRHMMIKFKGAQSSGIRSGSRNPVTGDRFAIILTDDVLAKEADAKSQTILQNVRNALFVDSENAMRSKDTQMIMVNTLYTKDDPTYSSIESGVYTPLVIPICENIYEGMPEKEFKGPWEAMHNYKSVMKRFRKAIAGRNKRGFMQELMCRISDEEELLVRPSEIKWYHRFKKVKDFRYWNFYVTTDFTSSAKVNQDSDFTSMYLWGVDHEGIVYLVDCIVRKMEIEDQYDKLFEMIDKWIGDAYVEIGVENNGNQRAHLVAVKYKVEKDDKDYGFAMQKGKKGFQAALEGIDSRKMGKTKLDRFKLVAPMIRTGHIMFPEEMRREAEQGVEYEDMKEVLNELKYTSSNGINSAHDDAIDGISQLSAIELVSGSMPDQVIQTKLKTANISPGQALIQMQKSGIDNSNIEVNEYSSYT